MNGRDRIPLTGVCAFFGLWLVVLLSSTGCTTASLRRMPLESPGRLEIDAIPAAYEAYDTVCVGTDPIVYCSGGKRPERIGHVLGAYQEYAMQLTARGTRTRKHDEMLRDATTLMQEAFDARYLDAVEFDVHMNTRDAEASAVLVLHHEPHWESLPKWPLAQGFLQNDRNSLRVLLASFFARYHQQQKRLYIELKAPEGCRAIAAPPGATCRRIAGEVAAALVSHGEVLGSDWRSIVLVSFSTQMLEAVYEALPTALRTRIDYLLIVGSASRLLSTVASRKGWVAPFSDKQRHWMVKTPWLTGVWYSPRAMRDFPRLIADVNVQRVDATLPCLDVGISVYLQQVNKFLRDMERTWKDELDQATLPTCGPQQQHTPAIVRSLIFDIDSRR